MGSLTVEVAVEPVVQEVVNSDHCLSLIKMLVIVGQAVNPIVVVEMLFQILVVVLTAVVW